MLHDAHNSSLNSEDKSKTFLREFNSNSVKIQKQANSRQDKKSINEESIFSLVGADTLHSNGTYIVTITLHKAEKPCTMKITLKGPSFEDSKIIELQPLSPQHLEFDLPLKLSNGIYKITAEGVSNINFRKSIEINSSVYQPLVFIHTDRKIYTGGDILRFLVIFLDEDGQPLSREHPICITINDGKQKVLKHWKHIQLTQGTYEGKLLLPSEILPGNWFIDVSSSEGRTLESQQFKVVKEDLPEFSVRLETAKKVSIFDDSICITVHSKYGNGEGVKGKASIKVTNTVTSCFDQANILQSEKTFATNGTNSVEFKFNEDLKLPKDLQCLPTLEIMAEVKDEMMGIKKQSSHEIVKLCQQRFIFKGLIIPEEFHINKPLIFKIAIQNLDNTPLLDKQNKIELMLSKLNENKTLEGRIQEENEPKVIKLEANLDENGVATFIYTFTKSIKGSYYMSCKFRGSQAGLGGIHQHKDSNDKEAFLALSLLTKNPQLHEKIEIALKSSEAMTYFVYTLASRGKVLKSVLIKLSEKTKTHIIDFETTIDMAPMACLFVHYIEGKKLQFQDIRIPIETNFDEKESINLSLGNYEAEDPFKYLKCKINLNKNLVFEKLASIYKTSSKNQPRGRNPGKKSGLVTLTNADYCTL